MVNLPDDRRAFFDGVMKLHSSRLTADDDDQALSWGPAQAPEQAHELTPGLGASKPSGMERSPSCRRR